MMLAIVTAVAFVVLCAMKLTGAIDWPWALITAPLWLLLLIVFGVSIALSIQKKNENQTKNIKR